LSDSFQFNSKRDQPEEEDMDMTPMVDVTFLLLIFFMITAAFMLQKAMEVPPVEDDEAAQTEIVEEELDLVVVRLDENNIYWVTAPVFEKEKECVARQEMREAVREARDGKGGKYGKGPSKYLVQANGDATHEYMVAALDAGAAVGMSEIRLMIYEEGDL